MNNNNINLAEHLDKIALELFKLDLSTTKLAVHAARKVLEDIDGIAQKLEIPSLRALTHWMLLNTEQTTSNDKIINELSASGSYFNWIEILSALLQTEDQELLEELQNSLNSPNWYIKPSNLLQTELLKWIETTTSIKIDNKSKLETLDDKKTTSNKSVNTSTNDNNCHPKVYEEVDIEILGKHHYPQKNKTLLDEQQKKEGYYKKIIKSNENHTKVSSPENNQALDATNQQDSNCFTKLNLELDEIIMDLFELSSTSENVLLDATIFNKKIEQLIAFSTSCSYTSIVQICRWCQRNIDLFSQSTSLTHSHFIETGECWTWLELINYYIIEPEDDTSHLSNLAAELARKEWLEPFTIENLQDLLLFLKKIKQDFEFAAKTNNETQPDLADTDKINTELNIEAEESKEEIKEEPSIENQKFSHLSFSWDEDIHPELLSAYFEETPDLVLELGGLLQKISNIKALETISNKDLQHASRIAHTIKGSSAVLGITALSEFSHKLEDILDYAANNNLPQDTSELLSESSDCLESLFEAIQNQQAIPDNFSELLSKLSSFAESLEAPEDEELLTLSTPTLPDFIQTNNSSDITLDNQPEDSINIDEVDEFCAEVDDIVMSLSTIEISQDSPFFDSNKNFLDKANNELQRLDLLSEISNFPEVSNVSQWCQLNLKQFFTKKDENNKTFLLSGECWSWIELISACLANPDEISYLSQLSQELMRPDWIKPIATKDLQDILLLLKKPKEDITQASSNLNAQNQDTDSSQNKKTASGENNAQNNPVAEPPQNTDYSFCWDEDIHPELLDIYLQETPEQITEATQLIYKITDGEANKEDHQHAARIVHTIKGASGVVGITALAEFTHKLEDILDYSVNHKLQPELSTLLIESADCLEDLFESIIRKKPAPNEFFPLLAQLKKHADNLQENESNSEEVDQLAMPELPDFIKNQSNLENSTKNDNQADINPTSSDDSSTNQASKDSQPVAKKRKPTETHIRVPISVIDQLLNLAGELVTTTSQLSDKIQNSISLNQEIRIQDNNVHKMLNELTNTISRQEKNQNRTLSASTSNNLDALEMDTYNELHSIAGLLSEGFSDSEEIDRKLGNQLREITDFTRSLELLNKELSDLILHSRMVSINSLIPRLERIIRQTCRKTGKKAELAVDGNDINIDTEILNKLTDPLLHLFRNSVDHGIEDPETRKAKGKYETGRIHLTFSREGKYIQMELKDDGAGIDPEKIYQQALKIGMINDKQKFSEEQILQFILQPGFTTQKKVTDISGRGVGMDVVNDAVKQLRGTLEISSKKDQGTCFTVKIPLTLVTSASLLVEVADHQIAITAESFKELFAISPEQAPKNNEQPTIQYKDKEIPIIPLSNLLGWPAIAPDFSKPNTLLLVEIQKETHAIYVDEIIKPREIVIKSLAPWINTQNGLIGACHLPDGGVAPVINLEQMLQSDKQPTETFASFQIAPQQAGADFKITPQILVVDDSLSNRKSLSLIIEQTEYKVLTAIDGLEALKTMNENHIDLVFTDLEMPRMNGLELTQSIRAWDTKKDTPVVMITSRTTSKHRQLAKKAGVNQYLTKPVIAETLLASLEHWLKVTEETT